MADAPAIVWFRQDLRLRDNPALNAVGATGRPVLPVYILDDETPGRWKLGGASRWWLHHSLTSLSADLQKRGAPLILRRGRADEIMAGLLCRKAARLPKRRQVHVAPSLRRFSSCWVRSRE